LVSARGSGGGGVFLGQLCAPCPRGAVGKSVEQGIGVFLLPSRRCWHKGLVGIHDLCVVPSLGTSPPPYGSAGGWRVAVQPHQQWHREWLWGLRPFLTAVALLWDGTAPGGDQKPRGDVQHLKGEPC